MMKKKKNDLGVCLECKKEYSKKEAKRVYGEMFLVHRCCSPQCYTEMVTKKDKNRMNTQKLLPCPFCGSTNIKHMGNGNVMVQCLDCVALTVNDHGWNTRTESKLVESHRELMVALDNYMRAHGGGIKDCGHNYCCICPGEKAEQALL